MAKLQAVEVAQLLNKEILRRAAVSFEPPKMSEKELKRIAGTISTPLFFQKIKELTSR